jgi:hypothetical protein
MMNHLSNIASLRSIAQEGVILPRVGLSVFETAVTYVAIPLALFFGIALLTYAATSDRSKKSKSSVITTIE